MRKEEDGDFKELKDLMEKYVKNKTNVSEADLKGRYRKAFLGLKRQIADAAIRILKDYIFEDIVIQSTPEGSGILGTIDAIFSEKEFSREVKEAVFDNCSIDGLLDIAGKYRARVLEVYEPYLQKFTRLEITAECLDPENPVPPRIYNELYRRYWDEEKQEWIREAGW